MYDKKKSNIVMTTFNHFFLFNSALRANVIPPTALFALQLERSTYLLYNSFKLYNIAPKVHPISNPSTWFPTSIDLLTGNP